MEELAEELYNDDFQQNNGSHNDPEQHALEQSSENPQFVRNTPAAEEVENLHEYKSVEDEGQMPTCYMVLVVVYFVCILSCDCVIFSICDCALGFSVPVLCSKIVTNDVVKGISGFWNELRAQEEDEN